MGGNVGIGTATPSDVVQIYGASGGTIGETIQNGNNNGYSMAQLQITGFGNSLQLQMPSAAYFAAPGSSTIGGTATLTTAATNGLNLAATDSAGILRVFTGGTVAANERMRIDSSGNVGIGTTSPLTALQIGQSGGSTAAQLYLGTIPSTSAPVIVGNWTSSNGWGIGAATTASDNTVRIGNVSSGAPFSWAGTQNLVLQVAALNVTSSSVNSTFAGNVGIGTTSPGQALEVAGNTKVSGQIFTGSQVISGGTNSVDWNNGNVIRTDYDCGSSVSFANLVDGGTYTLVVTGASTTQCNFSTTTTGTGAGHGELPLFTR